MTTSILELHQVEVRADRRIILDIDHFAVGAGESVALIGPNGAGKTTLLHVAALLRKQASGTVLICGQRATSAHARALRRSISVVFQDALLFSVTALENAAAGLLFQGMARKDAEAVAREWLDRFGISHLERRQARGLSGGEASRVALARAFATSPSLLLLDEPFSALDAPTQALLVPELRQHLHDTGTTAVLVSHDLEQAFAFADRLAVMEHGRILATGNAATLLTQPTSRRMAEILAVENILPASVTEVAPPTDLTVVTESGQRFRVHASREHEYRTGDQVIVTFPASHAHILGPNASPTAGWNAIAGTITASTPQRYGLLASVALPEIVRVVVSGLTECQSWHAGDNVTVTFPPDAVAVVPA